MVAQAAPGIAWAPGRVSFDEYFDTVLNTTARRDRLWDRFDGASIGAYLGLVPTESSSGANRSQGSITKTGNIHARRLLVEAAWQQQRPLRPPSKDLRARRDLVGPAVRVRAQAADRRLHQRWQAMTARRKPPNKIAVAVARELAGWCWSLAVMPD